MKLYQVKYIEGGVTKAVFVGSQAELPKAARALKERGMEDIRRAEVDVKTDKKGLIDSLNTLFAELAD